MFSSPPSGGIAIRRVCWLVRSILVACVYVFVCSCVSNMFGAEYFKTVEDRGSVPVGHR